MNWDTVQGKWKEMSGQLRQGWGDITDDEWQQTQGRREEVEGLIQKKYGQTKDQARQSVDDWLSRL